MLILGISAFHHDSAAALIRDGEIIAAAQEERFSRIKNDKSFPEKAINFCLNFAKIKIDDINAIAFYESQSEIIQNKFPDKKVFFVKHNVAHAASAFFPSPFSSAAVVVLDGEGEGISQSTFFVDCKRQKMRASRMPGLIENRFPHSLGFLYSAFTEFLGFRIGFGEYKVMGLAPYGKLKYEEIIFDNLVDLKDDGSFFLNSKYFNFENKTDLTNDNFCRLFNRAPRKRNAKISDDDADIAKSIQSVTEKIILKIVAHAFKLTGSKNLCLAGGVALNCVANGRILRESNFENLWIQPAAGDAGAAIGAALHTWYELLENPKISDENNDKMNGALLGPEFTNDYIKNFIENEKIEAEFLDDEALAKKIAKLIDKQKIIGLFRGRMEFGPRALGCRSILSDARNAEMQKILNQKIKGRESFRPFAPVCLLEHTKKYFELDVASPYMLLVARVKDGAGIPAVTHIDNSARVQTVDAQTNLFFAKILEDLNKLTGCAVIINTSFNFRDEPIVCSPEDAYRCFLRTGIDFLAMGNYLISQ